MHIYIPGGGFCWEVLGYCAPKMDFFCGKKVVHNIQNNILEEQFKKAQRGNISI